MPKSYKIWYSRLTFSSKVEETESDRLEPSQPIVYGTTESYVESNHLTATTFPSSQSEFLGLMLTLGSGVGFSLNGLAVKLGGQYFTSMQMVLARSLWQGIFGLLFSFAIGIDPLGPPRFRRWLFLRGLLGALGLAMFYFTLIVLPIADATVLFFTSPIFTAIIAHITLGEPYTKYDFFISLLSMVGIVLTARPPFLFGDDDDVGNPDLGMIVGDSFGAMIAVLGAVFAACAYTIVRKIGPNVHFTCHVTHLGIASALFSVVMVLLDTEVKEDTPSLGLNYPTLLLTSIGITAILGQCLLNKGLQLCKAGPATLMRNSDVVLAYLYGIFIFHEVPHPLSIIGSILIVLSTVLMGIKKIFT